MAKLNQTRRLKSRRGKEDRRKQSPAQDKGVSPDKSHHTQVAKEGDQKKKGHGKRGHVERAPGMSLAFKFALMVSCVVVLITGTYSVVMGINTWKALRNDIMLRGVAQVQMLALFGGRLIEQTEAESDLARELSGVDIDKDVLDKTRSLLRVPGNYLESISKFPSKNKSIDSGIVEAVIVMMTGKRPELLTSIAGKALSLSGDVRRCILDTGSGTVAVDVDIITGWMNIEGVGVPVMEFVKPIEDAAGKKVGEAILILSEAGVVRARTKLIATTLIATVMAIVAAIITSLILASIVTKPVRQLVQDMAVVSQGNFNHRTHVRSRDEIGLLSRTFNEMTKGLATAQTAAVEREKLERDLNIAQEIQQKLLPKKLPNIPGYDISAFYRAARDVGGDYYDFIPIDKQHIGMIVADVSGKGVSGSLVMTMTRTIVRFEAQRNPSPADTLKKVNRILAREIRRGMFVTAFYLILDVSTHTITFSSAGHNPMVFVRNETGKQWLLNPGGIALGFDRGPVFDSTVKEDRLHLKKGDRIILYTDGVVEAMNARKEQFGEKRFYDLAKTRSAEKSDRFVALLVEDLERHRGDAEQHDDITISTFSLS